MQYKNATLITKRAMANALMELIETEPYDKISINMIVEKCGLNRKTFYYHFKTKDELFIWTIENELAPEILNINPLTDFRSLIIYIMEFIEKNRTVVNSAMTYLNSKRIKDLFLDDFVDALQIMVIDKIEKEYNLSISDDYKNFLVRFYANATIDMVLYAISAFPGEKEKMIKYFYITLEFSMRGVIKSIIENGEYENEMKH